MSEMQGIEQKQAETTKGITATTAAIKDMSSKNEESNTGIKAGLNALVKVGLVESKTDRIARKATQRAANDAATHYAEMQKLAAQGNASAEDLAAAQEAAAKTAAEAAEAAKKQSLLSRFGDDEAPDVPSAGDPKKTGGTIKKLGKKLGGLALLLVGLLGLLLNTPAFKVISKALDDLIDWFASPDNPIVKFFEDIMAGNFVKAFDDAITTAIKSAFGVNFEGSVIDVVKRFTGGFLAGIANLLPKGTLRDFFMGLAAKISPEEAARQAMEKAKAKKVEEEAKRIDLEMENPNVMAQKDALMRATPEQKEALAEDTQASSIVKTGPERLKATKEEIEKNKSLTEEEKKLAVKEAIFFEALQRREESLNKTEKGRKFKARKDAEKLGPVEQPKTDAEKEAEEIERLRKEVGDDEATVARLEKRLKKRAGQLDPTTRKRTLADIDRLNKGVDKLNLTIASMASMRLPEFEAVTPQERNLAKQINGAALEDESGATTVINNVVAPTTHAGDDIKLASGTKALENQSLAVRFGMNKAAPGMF